MLSSLRPLSFGEILDGAFTLYRRNFLRFFGTSLVFGVAMVVVAAVLGGTGGLLSSLFGGIFGFLVKLVTLIAIAGAVMALWGALAWQAGRAYAGQKGSISDVIDASMDWAMNLVGVGVAAMALLFVAGIPGVMVALPLIRLGAESAGVVLIIVWVLAALVLVCSVLFAALPAVVLEGRGPLQAVSRSWQLASGALGQVAGVMAVAMLITALPGVGVEAMTGGIRDLFNPAAAQQSESVLKDLLGFVLNLLTAPFLASVCVVLYYDRRVRAEALDVQIMADRMAVAGD